VAFVSLFDVWRAVGPRRQVQRFQARVRDSETALSLEITELTGFAPVCPAQPVTCNARLRRRNP